VYDVSRPLKISILPSGCRRHGEDYAVEAATMRHYPIPLRATLTITLMLMAGAAVAGQREDGVAAVNSRDYATALRLFRPLANQGDDVAQFDFGLLYNKGWGVPRDYVQAVRWYRLAADQDVAEPQYYLGILYAKGQGVPQDFVQAHKWLDLSAAQDNNDAKKKRHDRGAHDPRTDRRSTEAGA
jgi:Sel1 repeat-containing protein